MKVKIGVIKGQNNGLISSVSKWRRDRDSNPGRLLHLAGFQDQCIQPLCHPSSVAHDDELGLISQQLKSLSRSILSY